MTAVRLSNVDFTLLSTIVVGEVLSNDAFAEAGVAVYLPHQDRFHAHADAIEEILSKHLPRVDIEWYDPILSNSTDVLLVVPGTSARLEP